MLNDSLKTTLDKKSVKKMEYGQPQLVCYGAVRDLTQNGTGSTSENAGNSNCTGGDSAKKCSERHVKQNVVRIGDHPLGIGMYLFDYKPEYCEFAGHGRQFGVMIDEVDRVMPEAVSIHADGFKRVDYAMLGIQQNVH